MAASTQCDPAKGSPDCLDTETLVNFLAGALTHESLQRLDEHLACCVDCAVLLHEYASGCRSDELRPTFDLDAPLPIAAGSMIGRYEIVHKLGVGGMGVVYAARDPKLDRQVALKLMSAQASATIAGGAAGLVREARIMAQLTHPNVLGVYDVGEVEDVIYIAMELVEGSNLREWLEGGQGQRSLEEIREVFLAVGNGLAAAHEAGVIHRDLKPENVLIGRDGRARVADFGLARGASELARGLESADGERTGVFVGTPAYMPPEQLEKKRAGATADQFAFCVCLYEALYGERPFTGHTAPELLASIRNGLTWGRLGQRRLVPRRIRGVLARGLRLAPGDRYPSMRELLCELKRKPHKRLLYLAIGGALGLALGGTALSVHELNETRRRCEGGAEEITAVWSPQAREALEDAFLATGHPAARAALIGVVEALDRYARQWTTLWNEACLTTHVRGEQSSAVLDLRSVCLDRRKRELSALVEVLTTADGPVIERAVRAVDALAPLAPCADGAALAAGLPPPQDESTRRQVREIEDELARLRALTNAGRYGEATQQTGPLSDLAVAVGYGPLLAEVLFAGGEAHIMAGEHDRGDELLSRSYLAAYAAGDDERAARALVERATRLARSSGQIAEARRLVPLAEAAVQRVGANHELQGLLALCKAFVAYSAVQMQEALTFTEAALMHFRHLREPKSEELLRAESLRGSVLVRLGRLDEAVVQLEKVLLANETSLGSDHPQVAADLNNLSQVYDERGTRADIERALLLDERAAAIRERLLGDEHPLTLWSRFKVAMYRGELGDGAVSLAKLEQLTPLFERKVTPARMVTLLLCKAELERELGRPGSALHTAKNVLTRLDGQEAGVSYYHVLAWTEVARDEIELGRSSAARQVAEKALHMLDALGASGFEGTRAEIEAALARALLQGGVELDRARVLAQSALPLLERRGFVYSRERELLAKALREHAAGASSDTVGRASP